MIKKNKILQIISKLEKEFSDHFDAYYKYNNCANCIIRDTIKESDWREFRWCTYYIYIWMDKNLYIYKYYSSRRTKEKNKEKEKKETNYVNALLISVRVIVNVLKKKPKCCSITRTYTYYNILSSMKRFWQSICCI